MKQDNGASAGFMVKTCGRNSMQRIPGLKKRLHPVGFLCEGQTVGILCCDASALSFALGQAHGRLRIMKQMSKRRHVLRVYAAQFRNGALLAMAKRADQIAVHMH